MRYSRICLISLVLMIAVTYVMSNFWSDKLSQAKELVSKHKKPFLDATKELLEKADKKRPKILKAVKTGTKSVLKRGKKVATKTNEFIVDRFGHKNSKNEESLENTCSNEVFEEVSTPIVESHHIDMGIKKFREVKEIENCNV